MTRFLVTGASGLLGVNFGLHLGGRHTVIGVVNQNTLNQPPFEVLRADLTRPGEIRRVLNEAQPEAIIHCAALANLEACEKYPEMAWRVNAEVPGELAGLAARRGLPLIHLSTDAVFDGQRGKYTEDDTPNPINVYARTKLEGEQAVLAAHPGAVVARVNFFGWSVTGKRSLGEWFYHSLTSGAAVKGFTDVFFCPLEVTALCDILVEMVQKGLHGVYHTVSPEALSKYEFGCRIARRFALDETRIQPVSWKDGGLTAVRSPNLTLRSDKLAAALGHALPGQEENLQRFYTCFRIGIPQKIRSLAAADQ